MSRALAAWGVLAVAVAVLCAPLAAVTYLPFTDLPNHLARHYLAAHLAEIPALQPYYGFEDRVRPNSAVDLIRGLLGWDGDIYLFGRLIVGFYFVNLMVAMLVLNRVLWGRWSAWPVAGALAAHSTALWFGFENFYTAIPFVLHGLSLWIGLAGRALALRTGALAAIAFVVYFMHIAAFGVMALVVACYEVGRRGRSLAGVAAAVFALVPPFLHFALVEAGEGAGHGSDWNYGNAAERFSVLASPFSRMPYWTLPRAEEAVALFTILIVVLSLPVLWHRGFARPHRDMVVPLGVLALFAVLMPEKVMGINIMQVRIPVIFAPLLFATLSWDVAPARLRAMAAVVVTALFAAKSWLNFAAWQEHDRNTAALIEASAAIGDGARVLGMATGPGEARNSEHHLLSYLLIERHAVIANLFHGANGVVIGEKWRHASHPHIGTLQPALLREALDAWEEGRDYEHPLAQTTFWKTWWRDFTHILSVEPVPQENPFPDMLREIASGPRFRIYEIVPPE